METLTERILPGQTPIPCSSCKEDVEPRLERRGSHISGDYPRSGKFLWFLKQRDAGLLPAIRKMLPRFSKGELAEVVNFARVIGGQITT